MGSFFAHRLQHQKYELINMVGRKALPTYWLESYSLGVGYAASRTFTELAVIFGKWYAIHTMSTKYEN